MINESNSEIAVSHARRGLEMSFPVLLVDDEPTVTNALNRALGLEFDLTIRNSGEDALQCLASPSQFPVIVTDLRMPKMDGVEFISEAQSKTPQSVFVILTGSHDNGTLQEIDDAGMSYRTLRKPVKKTELVKVIQSAYEESQRSERS